MRSEIALRLLGIAAISLFVAGPVISEPQLTREQANQIQRECTTIDQCVASMRTETAVNFSAILEQKFADFGEAAIAPLVHVLTDDANPRMRQYAAMALARMPRIDASYLPTLIAESRKGAPSPSLDDGPGWLAIPIGLVRDNPEALKYLFDVAELYGARSSTNAVQPAIERSSRDAWMAEARRRLEAFSPKQSGEYLHFLCELVGRGGWPRPDPGAPPVWLEPALVRIATDPKTNPDTRATAEYRLRSFRNPIAFAALLRDARDQFANTPVWDGRSRFVQIKDEVGAAQWERITDGELQAAILEIGRFGSAGRDGASLVRPFLLRRDLPDSRAEAALTLGLIGDRDSIPELLAALQDTDDWLLVYNAAEALGRLHAAEAKSRLSDLAHHHWSQAARHNAERALSMLEGGDFVRPNRPQSGRDINADKSDGVYFGLLRYSEDDAGNDVDCIRNPDRRRSLSQAPPGHISFPTRGAVEIAPNDVRRGALPNLSDRVRRQMPRGHVTAIERVVDGVLIGTNAGEFVGGLAFISGRDGAVVLIVPDNILMLFRHHGRLYALTGLSHLVSSYGEVWEIDLRGDSPRAARRIRLTSEAGRVLATARHDIAFSAREDTFLLGADGVLRGGDDQGTCERQRL